MKELSQKVPNLFDDRVLDTFREGMGSVINNYQELHIPFAILNTMCPDENNYFTFNDLAELLGTERSPLSGVINELMGNPLMFAINNVLYPLMVKDYIRGLPIAMYPMGLMMSPSGKEICEKVKTKGKLEVELTPTTLNEISVELGKLNLTEYILMYIHSKSKGSGKCSTSDIINNIGPQASQELNYMTEKNYIGQEKVQK